MRLTHGSRPGQPPLDRLAWQAAVHLVAQVVRTGELPGGAERRVAGEALALAAELHGVEGWVRRAVGPGNPALDRAVQAALGRHQRALHDLALAAAALDPVGVPFLVVKGPALVASCYPSPDLRSYVDLDLVVAPSDLGRAVRALQARGFALVDLNWPMLMKARVHELRVAGPTGGALDLHWALADGRRAAQSPSVGVLLGRSQGVELAGTAVRTLGPQDTAVHLAVHAAGSGGHRLIWLADLRAALEAALRAGGPEALRQTVDEWQARPAVALMLRRAQRALGLACPAELRGLVRPGAWRALTAAADLASPPELAGTGGSLSRLVARSCRSTPTSSLLAAAGKTLAWHRGGRRGPLTAAELLVPDDPRSSVFPDDGAQGAEGFFAAVAVDAVASSRQGRSRG